LLSGGGPVGVTMWAAGAQPATVTQVSKTGHSWPRRV
jgi:hypothetical protein